MLHLRITSLPRVRESSHTNGFASWRVIMIASYIFYAAVAAPQPLEVPAGYPTTVPAPPTPAPLPRLTSREKGFIPTLDAPPSPAALQSQKQLSTEDAEKGGWTLGVFAPLSEALEIDQGQWSVGEWHTLPDGARAGAVRVVSPGAEGIRLEFSELLLPQGAYAIAYGESGGEVFGPFSEVPAASESLWTPAISGDSAIIEVVAPAGAPLEAVNLSLRRIVHRTFSVEKILAGACNLDAACYSAWAATASAVGGLGVIDATGEMFCTCTLLNDTDPCTDTPLALTAHHCVGAQSGFRGADSLEFYWQYDAASCNDAPPSLLSVPRTTGGADYLGGSGGRGDTGGGNDFALLRLRQSPPANLLRAGYSTASPSLAAPVTCIHHPRGEYKRISFGSLTAVDNAFPALYHEVVWGQGTTEPGSSGSPLFNAATQQVIGQLWGGDASCAQLTGPDYFGRFNVTAPQVSAWLDPQRIINLGQASYSGTEGGTVVVSLVLTQPAPAGDVSVQYSLAPGTALPDADYTPASGTVAFLEGETQALLSITLPDADTRWEPEESFTISLSNPGACADLAASGNSATITILDNDIDSDGDHISDADELSGAFGAVTNPAAVDSDGDGLNDWRELFVFFTDANNPDTDGDGRRDGQEITFGSNPLVPDPNPLPSFRIPLFHS